MQILLTEEEYTHLKDTAEKSKYDSAEITLLNLEIRRLKSKYKELEDKYASLLVSGVSSTNERLKTTNDSRLT